mmetsp:Transcript_72374/g.225657  ORF Transcript_72374/g.225657 Transcript_72374/m.225657 type:complete len:559 (-) Transcript_72374:54-1730(-)
MTPAMLSRRRRSAVSVAWCLRLCRLAILAAACGVLSAAVRTSRPSAPPVLFTGSPGPVVRAPWVSVQAESRHRGLRSFGTIREAPDSRDQTLPEVVMSSLRILGGVVFLVAALLAPVDPSAGPARAAGLLAEFGDADLKYDSLAVTPQQERLAEEKKADERRKAEAAKAAADANAAKAKEAKKKAEAEAARKADAAKREAERKQKEEAAKAAAKAKKEAAEAAKKSGAKPAPAAAPAPEKPAASSVVAPPKPVAAPKPAKKKGPKPSDIVGSVGYEISNRDELKETLASAEKAKLNAEERQTKLTSQLERVEADLKQTDEAYKSAKGKEKDEKLKQLKALREDKRSVTAAKKDAETEASTAKRSATAAKNELEKAEKNVQASKQEIKDKLERLRTSEKPKLQQTVESARQKDEEAKREAEAAKRKFNEATNEAKASAQKAKSDSAKAQAEVEEAKKAVEKADPGNVFSSPKKDAEKKEVEKERALKKVLAAEKDVKAAGDRQIDQARKEKESAEKGLAEAAKKLKESEASLAAAVSTEEQLAAALSKFEPAKLFFGIF